MANSPAPYGVLQVASQSALDTSLREQDEAYARAREPVDDDLTNTQLAGHIRTQWSMMQRHRNSASGWSERLLAAQRVFNGEYDPAQLAAIRQFGGSDVYARVTAVKCRGASSLLREVYLGSDKPWGLDPTPEPTMPDDIKQDIMTLVQSEMQAMVEAGQEVDPGQMRDRINGLVQGAERAAKKKAKAEAKLAETKLDDFLVEGQFYRALAEFISDLPIFPFACVKGPVVRVVPGVKWVEGKAVTQNTAKMFWNRVSPFDLYFTPGVSDITDADVIEKTRLTRADLNDLLGVPGYNEDAIRAVLQEYGRGGLRDWADPTDSERAQAENRESPITNGSKLIDCLEFHGNVQGSMLIEWGMDEADITDPDRDYFVQAWLIGRHVLKVQIAPSPRKRHPYYITSFEKVPGTPVGNALPDVLTDIQDVANAALRALTNNLSISSGPQVVVNDSRLAPGTDGDDIYPWKRWHVQDDPMMGPSAQGQPPITFFQPNSNAQELLGVYEKFTQIADELSAIPRYITGSDRMGGAGRTASGLAMLMGNASKILQTVAANIDRDVINPLVEGLYDMVMLTDDTGLLRGDESIRVRGVDVAVQRETNRQRQMEFLQATMNPADMAILGVNGRAKVLREVSNNLGMDGDDIVPTEEDLIAKQQAEQVAQKQAAEAQALGLTPPGNGEEGQGQGQEPATKGANTDLGVQEANTMRGMAG